MQQKTILVVDDEYYNAEVLAFVLEGEGYRVLCASNGLEALEKLTHTAVDLVVLDLMMPIMTGAELGKAMRARHELASIPILLNSALAEPGVRQYFDQYDAFLRKPFLIREALDRVRALLGAQGDVHAR